MTEKEQKTNGGEQRSLAPSPKVPNLIQGMEISTTGAVLPKTMGEMIEFCKLVAYSGMVPKNFEGNPGAVMVAVQMGAELGMAPMTAVRSIYVVNGHPAVWGDAMLALVKSMPECQDVIEEFDEKGMVATCTVILRNRTPVTRTFSMADAKTAKLAGKAGPWQEYPKRMIQMRARSFACRDACPGALTGIYTREEVVDITEPLESRPVGPPTEGRAKVGSSSHVVTEDAPVTMPEVAEDIAKQAVKKAKEMPAPHGPDGEDPETGEIPPKRSDVPAQGAIRF